MDDDWNELIRQIGTNAETVGRLLKRKNPHTLEDLARLRSCLLDDAASIQFAIEGISARHAS